MLDLESIKAMSWTRRWHTAPVLREQTLAEHACQVALLALWLVQDLGVSSQDREEIMRLALVHDAHETIYGDMPYPLKKIQQERGCDMDRMSQEVFWGYDITTKYGALPVAVVRMADRLEAALFAAQWSPLLEEAVLESALEESKVVQRVLGDWGAMVRARVCEALGVTGC